MASKTVNVKSILEKDTAGKYKLTGTGSGAYKEFQGVEGYFSRTADRISGWVFIADERGDFVLHLTGVPGIGPVSACASEWDVHNNKPYWGDADIRVGRVNRAEGQILITAQSAPLTPAHCYWLRGVFQVRRFSDGM